MWFVYIFKNIKEKEKKTNKNISILIKKILKKITKKNKLIFLN